MLPTASACYTLDVLIILSGLPGSGKTTLARALARQIKAVHIRIDTIEQAIRRTGRGGDPLDEAGYCVGYELAFDNLRLGHIVVADSVNPIGITRDAWRDAARRAESPFVDVEVVCSDADEHRRRVDTRVADIRDHRLPTWDDVQDREYDAWTGQRIVIDTCGEPVTDSVQRLVAKIAAGQSP